MSPGTSTEPQPLATTLDMYYGGAVVFVDFIARERREDVSYHLEEITVSGRALGRGSQRTVAWECRSPIWQ